MKSWSVYIITLFIAFSVSITSGIDWSKSVIYDVPDEVMDAQFGKRPPSLLTPEDIQGITAYRFLEDTIRVLVIPVEWSDRPATYPRETLEDLLFSKNTYPGGSVADYFYEVSYGRLAVVGDVLDWYNAGSYFEEFNFESVLPGVDPYVDFSQYDANQDGVVDAIIFLRSGTGQEDSQNPIDIWSYAIIYAPGYGAGPYDGMLISYWNTSPELFPLRDPLNPQMFSGETELNRIGVFCHELTHNLGLPDLYDYDAKLNTLTYYTPADSNDHPVYDWCLMGYHGYGYFSLGCKTPSHLCGWSKMQMGWIQPTILTGTNEDVVIHNIETASTNSLYLLPVNEMRGEYFLLEYRNPLSSAQYDKVDSDFSVYFPAYLEYGNDTLDRGLLITHVHDSVFDDWWRINNGWPDMPTYTVMVEDAGYNPGRDAWSNPEGSVTDSAQWWYPYETRKGALFSDDVDGQNLFGPETYPSSDGYYGPTGIIVRVDSIVDDRLYAYVHNPVVNFKAVSLSPAPNAFSVPGSNPVEIVFSLDANESTINSSTFRLHSPLTGFFDGTIEYDAGTRTATFTPLQGAWSGSLMTALVSSQIETPEGDNLIRAYSWSFRSATRPAEGVFEAVATPAAGAGVSCVVAADIDGDDDLDLVTANETDNNVAIIKNDGDGNFDAPVTYPVSGGPVSVATADFDSDGDLDVAVAESSTNSVAILKNDGLGNLSIDSRLFVSPQPLALICADLDGDADLDLASANRDGHNVTLLTNDGSGSFAASVASSSYYYAKDMVAGDLDNDGDIDLIIVDSNYDRLHIIGNRGDGTFRLLQVILVGDNPSAAEIADLNGDGMADLSVISVNDRMLTVRIYAEPDTTVTEYAINGNPYDIIAADIDGDDDLDLAVAVTFPHMVSIFLNNGDGTLAAEEQYSTGGTTPYSLYAADFDADRVLELAVANKGSATVGILENPALYICGDANNDEAVNIGDAVYLNNFVFFPAQCSTNPPVGCPPEPYAAGDVNCDEAVNIGDTVYLINFVFREGSPEPCALCP